MNNTIQKVLYYLKIITDFNEYNKFVWNEAKKDLEKWFKENLDECLTRRFSIEGINYSYMHKFETMEGGVTFYVGVYASEDEMNKIQDEITGCCFVKNSSFSIYDPDRVGVVEENLDEELSEELRALVD